MKQAGWLAAVGLPRASDRVGGSPHGFLGLRGGSGVTTGSGSTLARSRDAVHLLGAVARIGDQTAHPQIKRRARRW